MDKGLFKYFCLGLMGGIIITIGLRMGLELAVYILILFIANNWLNRLIDEDTDSKD